MIEQDIEKAVIERVGAIGIDGMDVSGLWQPSAEGVVKGTEGSGSTAFLAVVANPRSSETFSLPRADITVSLALAVLVDRAPDGDALREFTEPLFALLADWQANISSVKADFTVEGFNPVGFRLDGGNVSYDRAARAWSVSQSFTLRGIAARQSQNKEISK